MSYPGREIIQKLKAAEETSKTGPWLKRGGSQGSPFFIHRYDSNAGLIRAVTSDNLFRIGLRWTRHAGNASSASFNGGLRPGG